MQKKTINDEVLRNAVDLVFHKNQAIFSGSAQAAVQLEPELQAVALKMFEAMLNDIIYHKEKTVLLEAQRQTQKLRQRLQDTAVNSYVLHALDTELAELKAGFQALSRTSYLEPATAKSLRSLNLENNQPVALQDKLEHIAGLLQQEIELAEQQDQLVRALQNDPQTIRFLQSDTAGRGDVLPGPLGPRPLVYDDYTASGRHLRIVDFFKAEIMAALHGNPHTEDNYVADRDNRIHRRTHQLVKEHFHATEDYDTLFIGDGTTAGLEFVHKVTGAYIPPATALGVKQDRAATLIAELQAAGHKLTAQEINNLHAKYLDAPLIIQEQNRPVVFITKQEHHSNLISWNKDIVDVVEIAPTETKDGLDWADFQAKVSDPRYAGRRRIVSFSAASNVTSRQIDKYAVARWVKEYDPNIIVGFDGASEKSYETIDLAPDGVPLIDFYTWSPHKALGESGSTGAVIFNRRTVYKTVLENALPSVFPGGGTVVHVGNKYVRESADVETRERAGSPVLDTELSTALTVLITKYANPERIRAIEHQYIARAFAELAAEPNVTIWGTPNPEERLGTVSLSFYHDGNMLHPRFVTRLFDDTYGILGRGGCSCAGILGHNIFNITPQLEDGLWEATANGYAVVKPGWTRLNFHYSQSAEEVAYALDAVKNIARYGYKALQLYAVTDTGAWFFRDELRSDADVSDSDRSFVTAALAKYADRLQNNPPETVDYEDAENTYNVILAQKRQTIHNFFKNILPDVSAEQFRILGPEHGSPVPQLYIHRDRGEKFPTLAEQHAVKQQTETISAEQTAEEEDWDIEFDSELAAVTG